MTPPGTRRRIVLGLVFGLLFALQGCTTRSDLEARRFQLAGPRARDCGHVQAGGETTKAKACAEQALISGEPFFVGVEGMAIDSHVVDVLVRSTGGNLTWLRLDTDTSGGSWLLPRPRLFEWACRSVTFSGDDVEVGGLFTCERAVA